MGHHIQENAPPQPLNLAMVGSQFKINITFVLASLTILLWLCKRKYAKRLPLPPGPKKLPIIGNLLDMPNGWEWFTYHKWCQEFNTDIIHLSIAGQNLIVLDTWDAASEILEKRSANYSGRARMPMINELMGWSFNFGFQPYGKHWRQHRRLFEMSFNSTAALRFRPQELRAARGMLRRLLKYPNVEIMKQIRHLAAETVIQIAYGIDVKEKDDPYVWISENAVHKLSEAVLPGAYLVDTMPILMYVPSWFPGAGFKRKARQWKALALRMVHEPFEAAKRLIEQGDDRPSFVSDGLSSLSPGSNYDMDAWTIASIAGTIYGAGSDTTTATISSCILGLLENPDILKKAQKEIDDVVGKDQLPSFEHFDKLPYITAITKEAFRWRDATPVSIPHLSDAEDEYKGFRIPAGSIIIPNSWAMLHNPDVYPEPFRFNPDRFIKNGELDPSVRDPDHTVFGYGRRRCPGRFMAFSTVWIALASIIAAFDLKKARDKDGKVVELSHEYVSALVVMPLPFECVVSARSTEMEEVIRATAEETY